MKLSFRQIEYFVAVAEIGQIYSAAKHLNISQSAITTAIKELEELLRTTLFIRSTRGMKLTDSGHLFLNHAYSILSSVNDALNSPLSHYHIKGHLKIATTYTVLGYFLPYHLTCLSQIYPNLSFEVQELTRDKIEEYLLDGSLDIALVLTGNLRSTELNVKTLINSKRRLWLPSHHKLLAKDTINLDDLHNEPYIMLQIDEAENVANRYWQHFNQQPRVMLQTTSVEAVRSLVANGFGITILSDAVYRPWSLEGKRIETRILENPIPSMDIGLAWSKKHPLTSSVNCFIDYFKQATLTPQVLTLM